MSDFLEFILPVLSNLLSLNDIKKCLPVSILRKVYYRLYKVSLLKTLIRELELKCVYCEGNFQYVCNNLLFGINTQNNKIEKMIKIKLGKETNSRNLWNMITLH